MIIKRMTAGVVCSSFLLSLTFSSAFAQYPADQSEGVQEASTTQAQETLASLFGRGAKMPSIPHPKGTVALPAFDSSGIMIDEGSLREAGRFENRSSENS
jgi:hypothetical protein